MGALKSLDAAWASCTFLAALFDPPRPLISVSALAVAITSDDNAVHPHPTLSASAQQMAMSTIPPTPVPAFALVDSSLSIFHAGSPTKGQPPGRFSENQSQRPDPTAERHHSKAGPLFTSHLPGGVSSRPVLPASSEPPTEISSNLLDLTESSDTTPAPTLTSPVLLDPITIPVKGAPKFPRPQLSVTSLGLVGALLSVEAASEHPKGEQLRTSFVEPHNLPGHLQSFLDAARARKTVFTSAQSREPTLPTFAQSGELTLPTSAQSGEPTLPRSKSISDQIAAPSIHSSLMSDTHSDTTTAPAGPFISLLAPVLVDDPKPTTIRSASSQAQTVGSRSQVAPDTGQSISIPSSTLLRHTNSLGSLLSLKSDPAATTKSTVPPTFEVPRTESPEHHSPSASAPHVTNVPSMKTQEDFTHSSTLQNTIVPAVGMPTDRFVSNVVQPVPSSHDPSSTQPSSNTALSSTFRVAESQASELGSPTDVSSTGGNTKPIPSFGVDHPTADTTQSQTSDPATAALISSIGDSMRSSPISDLHSTNRDTQSQGVDPISSPDVLPVETSTEASSIPAVHPTMSALQTQTTDPTTPSQKPSASITPIQIMSAIVSKFAVGGQTVAEDKTGVVIAGHSSHPGSPQITSDSTHFSSGASASDLSQQTDSLERSTSAEAKIPVAAIVSGLDQVGASVVTPKATSTISDADDQQVTPNPIEVVLASHTLQPGSAVIVKSGTSASFGSSDLIVGTKTESLPQSSSTESTVVTIGDETVTIDPTGVVIASHTLHPAGPAVVVSGTSISLGSSDLVIGSSTESFAQPSSLNSAVVAIGNETAIVNPSYIVVAGNTLRPGGTAIEVSGTSISLGSSELVLGTRTESFPAPSPANSQFLGSTTVSGLDQLSASLVTVETVPYFTIANDTFTISSSNIQIAGYTLEPGGSALTLSGTTVSVGVSNVVVGTHTEALTGLAKPQSTEQGLGSIFSTASSSSLGSLPAVKSGSTSSSIASITHKSRGVIVKHSIHLIIGTVALSIMILLLGIVG